MRAWSTTVEVTPWPEGGYKAEVPSLQGCWVVASTPEEAIRDIYEVIEMSITSRLKRGETLPEDIEPLVAGEHGAFHLDLAVAVL